MTNSFLPFQAANWRLISTRSDSLATASNLFATLEYERYNPERNSPFLEIQMKVLSLVAIASLFLSLGCNTEVGVKVTDSTPDQTQSVATNQKEAAPDSSAEATYTSGSSKAESKATDADVDQTEKPSATMALTKALSAVKADDKNLLVHFGSPG